jgi:hypothetical protein
MKTEYKDAFLSAQKMRNEGMLHHCGWKRLGFEFPPLESQDSDCIYISRTCLFIVNEDERDWSNLTTYIGVIFVFVDGKRQLECSNALGEYRKIFLDKDVVDDIFWKSIDIPELHSLDKE